MDLAEMKGMACADHEPKPALSPQPAHINAFAAAVTGLWLHLGNEIGGMNRLEGSKAFSRQHCLAAAATTVADKINSLSDIISKLDLPIFIGSVE